MFCERLGAGHHQLRVSWDLSKFSKNELSNVRIEYKGQWLVEQLTQQLLLTFSSLEIVFRGVIIGTY